MFSLRWILCLVASGLIPCVLDAEEPTLPQTADLPAPLPAVKIDHPGLDLGLSLDLFGGIRPRGAFAYEAGDAVGRSGGLSSFQLFLPFEQDCNGTWLLFSETKILAFDEGDYGCNLGIGGRILDSSQTRSYGGGIYYDSSDIGPVSFEQLTLCAETLGDWLDARANVYIPIGPTQKNNAGINFSALTGFDLEAGAQVWANEWVDTRIFAGVYHFEGDNVRDIWGPRLRLEARICDSANVYLSVQHDQVFDTTVNFGIALSFPRLSGRSYHDGPSAPLDAVRRLGDSLLRMQQVAVFRQ
jgi:hypothetical protein